MSNEVKYSRPPGSSANVTNAPAYMAPMWFSFPSYGIQQRALPRCAMRTRNPLRSTNAMPVAPNSTNAASSAAASLSKGRSKAQSV